MSHLRRHCSSVRNAADHFLDELTTFCSVALSTCSYAAVTTGHFGVWSNALTTGNAFMKRQLLPRGTPG